MRDTGRAWNGFMIARSTSCTKRAMGRRQCRSAFSPHENWSHVPCRDWDADIRAESADEVSDPLGARVALECTLRLFYQSPPGLRQRGHGDDVGRARR